MTSATAVGGRVAAAPLALRALALAVGASMLLPLVYLALRALEADAATVWSLLTRERTRDLLLNTAALTGGVLTVTTAIAAPLAWLTTRTDLRGARIVNVLAVLPLAVPGYVMAFALIGLSGHYGFLNQVFGVRLPRPEGWWGATLALSLYTFPYLYLNLRAALAGLDRSLEDSARALGCGPSEVLRRVVLPQMVPALLAGWLIIGLYVIGDFGAVALMRYEAFSYALYTQYSSAFDRVYAAWLALILVAIAVAAVWGEARLRAGSYARAGVGAAVPAPPVRLSRGWTAAAWAFVCLVVAASLGLPLAVLAFWLGLGPVGPVLPELARSFAQSLSVAIPAAALAAALAAPVAMLAARHPSPLSAAVNRLAFIGYAAPPLAFGLAFVFFALRGAPFLYQTHALLVVAYGLAFLALALGPIRSAFLQVKPSLEEAARSLGYGPVRTFFAVTAPAIRPGLTAAAVLVFVAAVKELPIAFLLAPTGFRPLSVMMFGRTSEGMLLEAAPFAAALIVFSGLFVGMVLRNDTRR